MLILVKLNLKGLKETKDAVDGDSREQYKSLWDYCDMVRKTNPGSCCKLKLEVQQALAHSSLHMTHYEGFRCCT